MPPGVTFTAITVGPFGTCAVATTGAAYCWGDNSWGQIGNGTTERSLEPVPVAQPDSVRFTSIAHGYGHVCALSSSGQAYCWGLNADAAIGDGAGGIMRLTPTPVRQPAGVLFSALALGDRSSCALERGSGQPYYWGTMIVYGNSFVWSPVPVAVVRRPE
jgi:alpha-tubulin suppressor-like RCC1 family protein